MRVHELVCATFGHRALSARACATDNYRTTSVGRSGIEFKSRELCSSSRKFPCDYLKDPNEFLNSMLLLQPPCTASMRWYAQLERDAAPTATAHVHALVCAAQGHRALSARACATDSYRTTDGRSGIEF